MTLQQELDMFGCSQQLIIWACRDTRPSMLVMSLLSDVQELIASVAEGDSSGNTGEKLELARQYVNRAKFIVMEYLGG